MKFVVPLLASTAFLLTACTGAEDQVAHEGDGEIVTQTVTMTAELEPKTASAAPVDNTPPPCSSMSGLEAVRANIDRVEPTGWGWSDTPFDTSTYDPCAPLSWVIVDDGFGASASPRHIMLFHHGEYVGTATKDPQSSFPKIHRTDANTIDVTYTWLREGEYQYQRSGSTWASFAWDEQSQSVVMSGDLPPY
ncbi:MAG: LppP/LprE family lipoprotein [Corynebacterium sp.]|nr:LppP/LprE family lipoprotein [Corynebacterium sp.]